MEAYLSQVLKNAQAKDLVIDSSTLEKHPIQGLMSQVYKARSGNGDVIIHIGEVSFEQQRQKVWEKIEGISSFFQNFSEPYIAKVFLAGTINGKYFIVQEMLPGDTAGGRLLDANGKIVDHWVIAREHVEGSIEEVAGKINSIEMEGAGWLIKTEKGVKGMYKNQQDFLDQEFSLWMEVLSEKESKTDLFKFEDYFKNVREKLAFKHSYLVHNDLVNPGNILVDDYKVTGILDWEWALAGDPAWEFSFNNKYSLKNYFQKLRLALSTEEKELFLERVKLYEPIFLLWALYTHIQDKDLKLYNYIRSHLFGALEKLTK